MKKFFKGLKVTIFSIIAILAVLLVGIFVYLGFFFDLNKYKPMIQDIVFEQTGRKMEIAGNASLGFSLIPTLELEKVSFENASWAKSPQMATLERLDVKFSILPLLQKKITVDRFILVKPEIFLEVSENGEASWDFAKEELAQAFSPKYADSQMILVDAEKVQEEKPIPVFGLSAQNILIEDGVLKFDNYKTDQHFDIKINEVSLQAKSVDYDINIGFDVVFNNEDIVGTARLGSLRSLLGSFEPYPIELKAKAFNVKVDIDGSVINPFDDKIHFTMNLNVFNPRGNFGAPKATFVGNVDGNLQEVKLEISKLDLEGSVITGDVLANIAGKIPSVNVSLDSNLIDVEKILPKEEVAMFVIPSFISSAEASKLVPATPIPYESLLLANANVNIDFKKVIVNEDVVIDGVFAEIKLKEGVLNMNPLKLKFGEGSITASAKMVEKTKSIELVLKSNNLKIQEVYQGLKPKDDKNMAIVSGGSTDINLNIQTTGLTARDLVRNLNGNLITIVSPSKVHMGQMKLFSDNAFGKTIKGVSSIFKSNESEKPKKKVETTLNCAVVRADISSGNVVLPNGIAVDLEDFKLSSNGSVNLRNDRISFGITPFSGDLNDIANLTRLASSFVKVVGTIDNPMISVDTAVVKKVAVAVATNATSSLFGTSIAPCHGALQGTEYANMFIAPKSVAPEVDYDKALKDASDKAKENVKEIKKDLKENINKEMKKLNKSFGDLLKK